MNDINKKYLYIILMSKWISTVGYRILENLVVSVEKRTIQNV